MKVYRLVRQKYSAHLSGKGASLKGGRWNSAGVELIYTAANRSLAMAEIAVHFTLGTLPEDYVMLTIFIPDDMSVKRISDSELPLHWNIFPFRESTQVIGDQFVSDRDYGVLKVPSVVTQGDYNFLINPSYREYGKIKIIDVQGFPFDQRIFE